MIIPARFAGPPDSANGGVIAASLVGEGPGEVTIRRPVPVETELRIETPDTAPPDAAPRNSAVPAVLVDSAGTLLAEAAPLSRDDIESLRREAVEMPRVSIDEARAAGARTPLGADHPFPTCFGCGPDAPHGLHCLAGPVGRDGLWAVAFTPPEHVLGRIAGLQLAPLTAGGEHAVVARNRGGEGRKRFSVSVIQDAAGTPLAVARATWIALNP